jgi:hypothetical protein
VNLKKGEEQEGHLFLDWPIGGRGYRGLCDLGDHMICVYISCVLVEDIFVAG